MKHLELLEGSTKKNQISGLFYITFHYALWGHEHDRTFEYDITKANKTS